MVQGVLQPVRDPAVSKKEPTISNLTVNTEVRCRTYSPLGADHPRTAQDLAILADSSECFCRMQVSDAEAVEKLRALFCLGGLS